ncbi:acyltransferase family protein [Phenylobacterium aquaticum]|uniref:acyltransferase family protein n=1 Tax=Phenylobacterium aquaticum TaxID=1763816 RepID=UPI001F5D879F|nr:acyltransferase [Phenylobacterium aquaticum]MCI3135122.1 acyltransferase [Phenylobacterium aquaticum]
MRKTRYYPALDGLRGVAALCVVLMHRHVWFGLDGALGHGFLAVDFFFMLSGFVIANAYDGKLANGLGIAGFMRARVLRLYPMLILGAAIGALWRLLALNLGVGVLNVWEVANLFGRASFVLPALHSRFEGASAFPLDPPTWSLFFELAINLVYVAIFRWLTPARMVAIMAAGFLALVVLALKNGGIDAGDIAAEFWLGFVRVTFPFFAGVLLHKVRGFAPLARLKAPFWAQAAILLAILNVPNIGWANAPFDLICVGLVFPALVISGSLTESPPAETRALKIMGDLSYPIYVLHYPMYVFLGGLGRVLGWLTPETQLVFGLASLAIILAASWSATLFYDRPVRAWLDGVARRRAGLAEAGSTGR